MSAKLGLPHSQATKNEPLGEIPRLRPPRVLHHELVHDVILIDALGRQARADHRAARHQSPLERTLHREHMTSQYGAASHDVTVRSSVTLRSSVT